MPGSSVRARCVGAIAIGLILLTGPASHAQTIRFIDTSPEQVGLITPREAGLPETLWQGTAPQRLAKAIAGLPDQVPSPNQHAALVNLLRVDAPPPAGEAVIPSIASLRVAALARLGAEQDALDLAELVPPPLRHTPLWEAQANVRLSRYDLAGACTLATQGATAVPSADWQRLRGFCRILRGMTEEAMVAAMLADEMDADDPVYGALFLAKQFPNRPPGAAISPDKPLHVAMLRALNLPLTPRKWSETSPLLAGAVARFPKASLETRTAAAEHAAAANTLSVEFLVQLYLATELTTPLGTLYRQAAFAADTTQRVAALDTFWAAAEKAGLYSQMAPFTLGYLAGLDLAGMPPDFAARALRAALVAGDVANVAAWHDALQATALRPEGAVARDQSYAVLALAGERVPPPEQWWAAWRKAAKPSKAQSALVAGLMEALGAPVPAAKGPRASRSAQARAMKSAPMGEAALLALTALTNSPKDQGLVVQAVSTLARVHAADARAIAVELAIAAGI